METIIGEAITPLYDHLGAFVPIEILELQRQGGPQEWHFEEAQRRMRKLQENPDSDSSILMAGHRKGLAASSIATLVECLAVMAFVPSGVKVGPLHFWPHRERDLKDMKEENTAQAEGPFSRFKLVRTTDVTGISGTGPIAVGVQWPDQTCELFWLKHGTTGHYKSIGQLREIHCYDVAGQPNATVEWIGGA